MDYGGAAAWLISFTLYVQLKSGRLCRCPSRESVLMTGCMAWLCNSMHKPTVQCNHSDKRPLCCLSCGDLQRLLPRSCTAALKKSQGDPDRCWMAVLSWLRRALSSSEVISSRSRNTTHFHVTAHSCGSAGAARDIRSSVIFEKPGGCSFPLPSIWCKFGRQWV